MDDGKQLLVQCDASVVYYAWKTTAIGMNNIIKTNFLEIRRGLTSNYQLGIWINLLKYGQASNNELFSVHSFGDLTLADGMMVDEVQI
ncbi:uncharacterized protein isoform X2 [Rhodnius prolixus]